MTSGVAARAKGWGQIFKGVGAIVLGSETQDGCFPPVMAFRYGVSGRRVRDRGKSLARLSATNRQRAGDLPVTAFKANLVAAILGEGDRHSRQRSFMRDDWHAAAGPVLAATFAAVGGVQGVRPLPGDRLGRKGFDLEIALVSPCGQAGRCIYRSLPVAASEADGDGYPFIGSGHRSGKAAWAMRAASSKVGSDLPRLLARRRIPVQAIGLKKYLCGIESITTTCHKKHALAPLGDTEILRLWIALRYAQKLHSGPKTQASPDLLLNIISDDDFRGMSPRKSEI